MSEKRFCHFNGFEVKDAWARKMIENCPVVTPQMFGAVGDGVADDTAAVTACLNSTAGFKYFPKGVYNVTGVAAAGMKNCVIYGYGAILNMTKTHQNAGDIMVYVLTNTEGRVTEMKHDGFIEIYGLTIKANASKATIDDGINFYADFLSGICLYNYESVKIVDCTVDDTIGTAVSLCNCNNSYCERCNITNIGRRDMPDKIVFPNYTWDGISATDTVWTGTERIYGTIESCTVSSCYFENIAGCSAAAPKASSFKFVNNTVIDNHGYCIEDGGSGKRSVIISGNTYKRTGTVYALNAVVAEGDELKVDICNNIVEAGLGDVPSAYISTRYAFLMVFEKNSNPATDNFVINVENNIVRIADEFDNPDGIATKYMVIYANCGRITAKNNRFFCTPILTNICSFGQAEITFDGNEFISTADLTCIENYTARENGFPTFKNNTFEYRIDPEITTATAISLNIKETTNLTIEGNKVKNRPSLVRLSSAPAVLKVSGNYSTKGIFSNTVDWSSGTVYGHVKNNVAASLKIGLAMPANSETFIVSDNVIIPTI